MILVLQNFIQKTFGVIFPPELIGYITMIAYQKIKISCSWYSIVILVNDMIYRFGNKNRMVYDGKNIKSINCYNKHMIAKSFENNFYYWGDIRECNEFNIPGGKYYDTPYIDSSGKITKIKNKSDIRSIILKSDGEIWFACNRITIEKPVKKLICMTNVILILTTDNKLYSNGANHFGQLGVGNEQDSDVLQEICLSNVQIVKCGDTHTIALTLENKLYGWGYNNFGNLGLGDNVHRNIPTEIIIPTTSIIASVCCGADHTMILLATDEIYVWGYNGSGCLGLGHRDDMFVPQKLNLYGIRKLISAGNHTFAITKTDHIYAWGKNYYGQPGLDHYEYQLVPIKINL